MGVKKVYRVKKFNLNNQINCVKSRRNFSFSKNTTYGCGGAAALALYPKNIPQAKLAFSFAKRQNKYFILGNGSNVLAADNRFCGVVVSLKNFCGIYRVNENEIFCLAGTKIYQVIKYCKARGLGGLEYMAGIPASIGGAAYMNAGAQGKYISQNILKVRLFNNKVYDLSNKNCNFAYKHSTMRDIKALILGVFLKICPNCSPSEIDNNIKKVLQNRRVLPKGKSCGCVFKNYNGVPAGKIIEECGLKGRRCGFAYVSTKHANFIINEGSDSSDVKFLIDEIKREVKRIKNIDLQEEVVYIGDFNGFNC